MVELKTKENDASVDEFLEGIEPEQKRADCRQISEMMREITGELPRMWGTNIIGFARYQYTYESGREGEWFQVGFAPRARNITLYIMSGFSAYDELLEALGKHKTGKSCLYINRLADVDESVLRDLIESSVAHISEKYRSPR